jgi:hypothetical protein
MLTRLADRLVLCPSRDPLTVDDKTPRRLPHRAGELEVFTMRAQSSIEPQAFILKFGGAGSRAERAGLHPAEAWPDLHAEVWAVNYPGYGNSSGRASLESLAHASLATYEHLAEIAAGRPILLTGNSIGTACALYVAAVRPVAGLLLRNPPPLRQLILGRFGWWNLWLGAGLIARQIPAELCSLVNAARVTVPAVFVMSGCDRVVPPRYQHRVIEAYAGAKRILVDPAADHGTPLAPELEADYRVALEWLKTQTLEGNSSQAGSHQA